MDIDKRIAEDKAKIGWTVMGIGGAPDFPPFNYTVGMVDYDLPEIICVGLPIQASCMILNNLCNKMMDGFKIETGKSYDDLANLPMGFIEVTPHHITDKLCLATRTAGTNDIKTLQLVWSDTNGKLPWEKEFEDKFRPAQPLLNVD